jgi:hypothetical protein
MKTPDPLTGPIGYHMVVATPIPALMDRYEVPVLVDNRPGFFVAEDEEDEDFDDEEDEDFDDDSELDDDDDFDDDSELDEDSELDDDLEEEDMDEQTPTAAAVPPPAIEWRSVDAKQLPLPEADPLSSGSSRVVTVRMSADLHAALLDEANRLGIVSLNKLCLAKLAAERVELPVPRRWLNEKTLRARAHQQAMEQRAANG